MLVVLATVLLLQQLPAVGSTAPAAQGAVAPYFRLAAEPASASVARGATTRVTITVTPLAGFASRVSLVASHLLGTTIAVDPSTLDATAPARAAVTISPAKTAIKGTFLVTVTGAGGGASHTITIKVKIG